MSTTNNGAIALIDDLIKKAVKLGASDIHLEPQESNLKARYRVDGMLRDGILIHKSMQASAISRVKIMVGVDIAESRLPQDGRSHIKIEGKDIDLRVSTIPTIFGEKAVLRILNRENTDLSLSELGMGESDLNKYKSLVAKLAGIILVTGPTGSGKTTTLYSSLNQLRKEAINITTIEDPVEYQLHGINQIQVNYKSGLTFKTGLRSILRQDPDVIMVGEIRDEETARIAVQAALTGHLVFSTLHTNDSVSAIIRLLDMGIESYLINSTLIGVVAQRLIRVVCPHCRKKGCKECNFSGFRGRTGIYEILNMNDEIREEVGKREGNATISQAAKNSGLNTLFSNGLLKVKEGITTIEEIRRAVYEN
ncbi:MAG: GspE/PulE family protein [Candidatus Saganbacteria bacterium]|nr:GspE/PulE family protein [Candidatus Saganbacteria bacterium]